jgi:hypothetical protein
MRREKSGRPQGKNTLRPKPESHMRRLQILRKCRAGVLTSTALNFLTSRDSDAALREASKNWLPRRRLMYFFQRAAQL